MEPARTNRWRPTAPTGLWIGTAAAIGGACVGREAGLAAAAMVCVGCALALLARRALGPWILAAPAALGAVAAPTAQPRWPQPGPVEIRGRVEGSVRTDWTRRTQSFFLATNAHRALCVVTGIGDVLPGDAVRGTARWRRPTNAGGLPIAEIAIDGLTVEPGPATPGRWAAASRNALERSLLARVDGVAGDLLCHLVLGRGPQLPDSITQAHRASGVTHLLAVSGAHASMLAAMLAMVFGGLTGRAPMTSRAYRRTCGSMLIGYGLITGLEPPVFRAVVAFLLLLVDAPGRRSTIGAALAVPALLTALLMPEDLLGVSFCLSYAAVFGLGLAGALRLEAWHGRFVWTPLYASFWATLTTMPLTLVFFGQIAPWTIVATPILAPVVAIMLALGLIVSGLGLVCVPLADLIAAPLTGLTSAYCGAVTLFAELPWTPILAPRCAGPAALTAAAVLGGAALFALRDRRGVAILCVTLSVPHFVPAPARAPGLALLDVGHGQACLADLADGRCVLIDCGALGRPRRAANRVAAALLPRRRLDLLVLTHGDHDHVGGVPALLGRVRIERAVAPRELRHTAVARALTAHGTAITWLDDGEEWGDGDLEVYRPHVPNASRNDRSAWVRARCGTFEALLTGDAMERGVRAWLASPHARAADLVVLPHHGREHRACRALLHTVRPQLALISDAARDRPAPQAEIAAQRSIPTLATGDRGTITVSGTDARITTERPRGLRR